MEASESLSCENNNISLFSALPESSNMYSNKDSNLISDLTKHLTVLGQMWTKYLSLAIFAYNTFNSPNLGNYSPYELTFRRKPKLLLNVETNPDINVSRNFREYYESLNRRIKYLQNLLFNFKSQRLAMINKDRENFQ